MSKSNKSTEYLKGLKHAESVYQKTYAARQNVDNMDAIQAHYESKLTALDSVLHAPFSYTMLSMDRLKGLIDFNAGICAYAAHVDRVFEIEYQQKTT
jgi:hypothetical protein